MKPSTSYFVLPWLGIPLTLIAIQETSVIKFQVKAPYIFVLWLCGCMAESMLCSLEGYSAERGLVSRGRVCGEKGTGVDPSIVQNQLGATLASCSIPSKKGSRSFLGGQVRNQIGSSDKMQHGWRPPIQNPCQPDPPSSPQKPQCYF